MAFSIQRLTTITAMALICLMGILFNIIVIITIARRRVLHTTTYLLYVHLAVCDTLLSLFGATMGIAVFTTGEFIFCRCIGVVASLNYIVSIASVTLISYDRFVYLKTPLLYFQKVTKKKLVVLICVVWMLGLSLTMITLALDKFYIYKETYTGALDRKNCVLSRVLHKEFLWVLISIVLASTVTAAILNFKLLLLANTHHKIIRSQIQNEKKNKQVGGSHMNQSYINNTDLKNQDGPAIKNKTKEAMRKNTRRLSTKTTTNKKAIYTVASIVMTNLLCTLPFLFVLIIEISCDYCISYKKIRYAYTLFLLNYLTTVINPVIHTLVNSELRKQVKKILQTCLCYSNNSISNNKNSSRSQQSVTDATSLSLRRRTMNDIT